MADFEDGLPALLTIILMPLTYDITVGIGAGFISWVLIKVVRGKAAEVHWLMWLVSLGFVIFFAERLDPGRHEVGADRGAGATRIAAASLAPPRVVAAHRGRPPRRVRRRSGASPEVNHPGKMYENGPRCPTGRASSAPRLPGARSFSVAAYVLAGSRLEAPRAGRRGPFHGAPHLQGHAALPHDARRSPRRSRASAAASTPRRTASRPSTGSASRRASPSAAWMSRRADRPADARRRRDRPRAGRHRRGDPLVPRRPSQYVLILFDERCSATARWAARSPATRRHPGAARRRRSATSGRPATGPRTRSWRCPATSATRRPWGWSAEAFGRGNGPVPGCVPGAVAARRPARSGSTSGQGRRRSVVLGVPALRRDHPDAWTLAVLNAVLGDGIQQPALPEPPRGAGPGL